ncbi:heme oxygenase-like protein [Durotheca rogersii]|uniref:heme oxygenase-like protein n=1 Tax=Durotheca rogersii TaxID=419775 RepID=UPI0022201463|nr:heme oxygenase-like protein [Durotheca rogersii]KAI5862111.1 heme oxygenase-like protein [Durotheca rogersii]
MDVDANMAGPRLPLVTYLATDINAVTSSTEATKATFLARAGQGTLPREVLSQWLSQDRLYAQAYVRFAGGLISRVQLPTALDDGDEARELQWRILDLLQDALAGVTRELRFFEETAKAYGLDLAAAGGASGFAPATATQGYIDLFDSFAARPRAGPARTLLEGLVVLWATERTYLDSWGYARDQTATEAADLDGGALRQAFIPNWTSDEFRTFVRECEECLDAYAKAQGVHSQAPTAPAYLALYKQVLDLEKAFWPVLE